MGRTSKYSPELRERTVRMVQESSRPDRIGRHRRGAAETGLGTIGGLHARSVGKARPAPKRRRWTRPTGIARLMAF